MNKNIFLTILLLCSGFHLFPKSKDPFKKFGNDVKKAFTGDSAQRAYTNIAGMGVYGAGTASSVRLLIADANTNKSEGKFGEAVWRYVRAIALMYEVGRPAGAESKEWLFDRVEECLSADVKTLDKLKEETSDSISKLMGMNRDRARKYIYGKLSSICKKIGDQKLKEARAKNTSQPAGGNQNKRRYSNPSIKNHVRRLPNQQPINTTLAQRYFDMAKSFQ
jgi:hypothetical protein